MPRSVSSRVSSLALLVALPATAASAQSVHSLRGLVRDHLLRPGVLSGASVTLSNGATATTDSVGRFVIAGLAPGRYRVEVSHPAYDSLDVTLPTFDVELPMPDDREIGFELPDAAALGRTVCGAPLTEGTGVVFGRATGTRAGEAVRGLMADLAWTELTAQETGFRRQAMGVRDSTDAQGRFILCDVPMDLDPVVRFRDANGKRRDVTAVGSARLRRADITWPTTSGTARLRVRVTDAAGPVGNAIVQLAPGSEVVRTDADGGATLRSVALGSWSVSVRALGRSPSRQDVVIRGDTVLLVSLPRIGTLAGVRVEARGGDSLGRAIADRQQRFASLVFGDDRTTGASVSHGFWTKIPGMRLRVDGSGAPVPTLASGCRPTLFVDDQRFERWQPWLLQEMLRTARRLELYTLPQRVPPQYRSFDPEPCGAIVVWTW